MSDSFSRIPLLLLAISVRTCPSDAAGVRRPSPSPPVAFAVADCRRIPSEVTLTVVYASLVSGIMETSEEREEPNKEMVRKAGTVNWGTATLVGVFAGMLYGGSKEASASVSKDAEVMLKLGSTPDKREQYRLMRDAMEKRFVHVTRGSIVGGVRLGLFTASFFGIQNLLAEKRGVHDVFNIVGAGSVTAAAWGLILPGSIRWRARNLMMGSVLGAALGFPLGWLHLKLVEMAQEGKETVENDGGKGGVGAAIERLEANLRK